MKKFATASLVALVVALSACPKEGFSLSHPADGVAPAVLDVSGTDAGVADQSAQGQ